MQRKPQDYVLTRNQQIAIINEKYFLKVSYRVRGHNRIET